MSECKMCCGNGEVITDWDRYLHSRPGDKGDEAVADCPDCDGTGIADNCVVCANPIANRSTYIPTEKGPMHPACWEYQGVRAEATLAEREACAKVANQFVLTNPHTKEMEVHARVALGIAAAIRARTATQAEGKLDAWADQLKRGEFAGTSPQPPASPSQEGGMREAVWREAAKHCKDVPYDHLPDYFNSIADEEARAALAHDGGKDGAGEKDDVEQPNG